MARKIYLGEQGRIPTPVTNDNLNQLFAISGNTFEYHPDECHFYLQNGPLTWDSDYSSSYSYSSGQVTMIASEDLDLTLLLDISNSDIGHIDFDILVNGVSVYHRYDLDNWNTAVNIPISLTLKSGDSMLIYSTIEYSGNAHIKIHTLSATLHSSPIEEVAHNVKRHYIGDSNAVAQRIKKAYVGIGGVARPLWTDGKPTYWGTLTNLSSATAVMTAASNEEYAIFLGGQSGTTIRNNIYAYNRSRTRTLVGTFSTGSSNNMASASMKDYAVFGDETSVFAFDKDLSKITLENLGVDREDHTAVSNGEYILFCGGGHDKYGYSINDVVVYDSSLTKIITSLKTRDGTTYSHQGLVATTIGKNMIFGGGELDTNSSSTPDDVVIVFDENLTKVLGVKPLIRGRKSLSCAKAGNCAVFGPGRAYSSNSGTGPEVIEGACLDCYDETLTRCYSTNEFTFKRHAYGASSLGGNALFVGGSTLDGATYNSTSIGTFYIDPDLTVNEGETLSRRAYCITGATVGDYAIFAGGYYFSSSSSSTASASNKVEAFTI